MPAEADERTVSPRSEPRGRIVVLNGAPRSGKTSIAVALSDLSDGGWLNIGVDSAMAATQSDLLPGVGLRPGGERPDLETAVVDGYRSLVESVVSHARHERDVVVDVGLHDSYSRPLGILRLISTALSPLDAWLVGVRCPLEEIMRRRERSEPGGYLTHDADGGIPEPVLRWERAVHTPGIYDLEVDTGNDNPETCVRRILDRLESAASPTAFRRLVVGG